MKLAEVRLLKFDLKPRNAEVMKVRAKWQASWNPLYSFFKSSLTTVHKWNYLWKEK